MLKGRAVYVPLDAAFPTGRLALITADAGLRLVLTHSRFLLVSGESCPQEPGRPLAPALPAFPERLRSHRGDRDRDVDGAGPGAAGDDRGAHPGGTAPPAGAPMP